MLRTRDFKIQIPNVKSMPNDKINYELYFWYLSFKILNLFEFICRLDFIIWNFSREAQGDGVPIEE